MTPSIHYQSGYKYQLTRTYKCPIGEDWPDTYTDFAEIKDGVLTVWHGYAWDGPSGPTLDTKSAMRGSLEHDVYYQMMRQESLPRTYRMKADARLETVCLEDGMWEVRAKWWERLLNKFGGRNAHPDNKRRELVAP